MILYSLLIFVLFIFSFGRLGKIDNKVVFRALMVVLWLFASVRSVKVGSDTESYFRLFNSLASSHMVNAWTWRYEKGYLILNNLLSYLVTNYSLYLLIINSFFYVVYYKFIRTYSKDYNFSVFLFFTLGIWGNTVNIIRLEFAVAIVLLAYMMLDSGKKWISRIFSFVGIFFQRISITYVLALFIPKRISKKFYTISFIGVCILFGTLKIVLTYLGGYIPYFSEYYLSESSSYLIGDIKVASVINVIIEFSVFLFCLCIYLNKRKRLSDSEGAIIESHLNLVYIAFLFMFLSMGFNLLDRCSYLYWTFSIVLIPNVIELIKPKNRYIVKFIIALLGIAYFVVINVYKPEWNGIVPYSFFWEIK